MIETQEAPHRPSSALRTSFTMGLFKRKPVASDLPIEKEARQRTRLVKPQTSRSSTNLAVLALQQSASQSTISVQSESPLSPTTFTPTTGERRLSEKPRPVSTVQEERESIVGLPEGDHIQWHAAAVVIDAVESTQPDREDTVSPMSMSAQKPRRPFSAMVFGSRRTSGSHTASRNFSFEEASRSRELTPSPAPPMEVVIEGAPRVLERRASFTPGAATRVHKASSREAPLITRKPVPKLHREPSYELASADQLCDADKAYYYDATRSSTSPLGELEVLDFEEDWEPPPHIERSNTPSDLDYHYLGGLRLGSLHVTNGRASPAPSELSKHLLHRPSALLRRDASSEYGSDIGSIKRTHSPPPSAWKRSKSQEFSQARNYSQQSHLSRDASYGSESAFTAQTHAHGLDVPSPTRDTTTSMAMSYMSEIPNSPFSPQRTPQPEAASSLWTPQRSSSPTGSVLVTSKKSEHEAELFEDETVGESQGSEEDRDTISTCRTPSDAASHRVNPFDQYNKLRKRPSQVRLPPPQDVRGETSDSGYSSNASLQSMKEERKSLVAQRIMALEQPRAESAAAQVPATNEREEKVDGPRPQRASILKWHRKTAPNLPTISSFGQISTVSTANSQETTSTTASRPKTPSKKLHKKQRASQPVPPEEIMVTGAQSSDESEVPPIPPFQTANLMTRSQQFPELQRTFKSMHHVKDSNSSIFSQTFSAIEIRFPSPPPEPTSDDDGSRRSKSPFRSKSPSPKRGSFIARAMRRKSIGSQRSTERSSSRIGEADTQAIIEHFGTNFADPLGGSPYDIAKAASSRPQSRSASRNGRKTPDSVTTTRPMTPDRRRLTMDDRTASEYARSKSKSIVERDRQDSVGNLKRLEDEKRTVLNGKLGKKPRPQSVQPEMMATLAKMPVKKLYEAPKRPLTMQQQYERPAALESHDARPVYSPPRPHSMQQQYTISTAPGNDNQRSVYSPARPQTTEEQDPTTAVPEEAHWSEQQQYSQPQQPTRPAPPPPGEPWAPERQLLERYEIPAPDAYQQYARSETENQYWPRKQEQSQTPQDLAPEPPRHSPNSAQQEYWQTAECSTPPLRQSPWPERQDCKHQYEMPAPLPPRHFPRPSFVEPEEMEDVSIAPSPPSHSPRPRDVEPAVDVWEAQAQAWRNRRKSVGEFLGFDHDASDQQSAYTDDAVVEEELYPSIPPREPQGFHTPYLQSQTSYTPHESRNPYPHQPPTNIWQPAAHHHATTYEPDLSKVTPAETFQDPAAYPYVMREQYQQSPVQGQYRSSPRPLPKPKSRRTSGVSQAHSHASSLAEELHPEINDRPQPPPDFGRYSGGLQFSYEKGKGFGGSAGTRTVSGRAQGTRRSVPLSAEAGLDFSDIPVIAGMKRM